MHFMLYIIEISPDANLGSSRCVTQYRDDTVCHPAIILNCLRVQNLSLGAVWASPTANGQPKQLYEKNCELRSNSKLWWDGILYHTHKYLIIPGARISAIICVICYDLYFPTCSLDWSMDLSLNNQPNIE